MRAVAVTCGDGIGPTEHLLREIGIVAETLLVGTILAEDLDVAHVIGCDDDVAARMRGAGDVCWGFFRFA